MAYSANKLALIARPIGRGPKVFLYNTSDSIATILGAGYISDGVKHGMQLGDVVLVFSGTLNTALTASPSTAAAGAVSEYMTSNPTYGWFQVASVNATTFAVTLEGVATELAGNKFQIGQATSALVGFFGTTPISQRAAAILTATASLQALTGASFVANTSTTLSGFFVLNSTLASQLFDSLAEIRATLVAYGLHKGGA